MICCHCGSRNVIAAHQILGHRNMCEECIEKKQPLIKGSMKTNAKRVIKELKKKAQKKRKVNVKNVKIEPSTDDTDIATNKEDEDECSTETDDSSTDSNEDIIVIDSNTETEDDNSSNDEEASIVVWEDENNEKDSLKVNESIFKKSRELYKHYSLTKINVPPYGDCMPQACMVAYFNLPRELTDSEEEKLSEFNWSIANLVINGKT